jgi:hypothetical protein
MEMFEAKDNPMFPPALTSRLRFVRYSKAVPCACCGRKSRHHWTLTCSFSAKTFTNLPVFKSSAILAPMTPVCSAHPLSPEITVRRSPSKRSG